MEHRASAEPGETICMTVSAQQRTTALGSLNTKRTSIIISTKKW